LANRSFHSPLRVEQAMYANLTGVYFMSILIPHSPTGSYTCLETTARYAVFHMLSTVCVLTDERMRKSVNKMFLTSVRNLPAD